MQEQPVGVQTRTEVLSQPITPASMPCSFALVSSLFPVYFELTATPYRLKKVLKMSLLSPRPQLSSYRSLPGGGGGELASWGKCR